jgi:hypothetical protein
MSFDPTARERKGVGKVSGRTLFEKSESLFFSAVALGSLVTFLRVASAVPLPFHLDFGEGPLLGTAVRVARGWGAYPQPDKAPYVISPYGPIPYYIFAALVKLFGVGFTAPRLFIVASGVWCAVLIALLVCHWTGSHAVGWAFGILFLTRPTLQDWLFIMRVDLLGLAFSLTGLYLFAKSRRWYLPVPFFVAGFFCKFTLLAAPFACLMHAFSKRDWGKALKFAVCVAIPSALIVLLLQWETGGWFVFHAISANAGHPHSLVGGVVRSWPQLMLDIPLLVAVIVLIYYEVINEAVSLPVFYVLASLLTTLAAVGKLGASSNYFLEWEAALCLGAGCGYAFLRRLFMKPGTRPAVLFGLLASLALANTRGPRVNEGPSAPWVTAPSAFTLSGCGLAYEYVKSYRGEQILSESVGPLVMAGKPAIVFEPFLWTREVLRNGWPDTRVVNLIRSREIQLIILSNDAEIMKRDPNHERWPPSVPGAIEDNYKLTRIFDCAESSFAYEPKP